MTKLEQLENELHEAHGNAIVQEDKINKKISKLNAKLVDVKSENEEKIRTAEQNIIDHMETLPYTITSKSGWSFKVVGRTNACRLAKLLNGEETGEWYKVEVK